MIQSKVNGIIDTTRIENGLKQTIISTDSQYNIQLDTEAQAYSDHISTLLPPTLNFNPKTRIFSQIKDGIILSHVLNSIKPGCIDLTRLVKTNNVVDKKYVYEATSNLALVLNAASALNIKIVNIGPEDILYENKILVLGLLWQIVRLSVSRSLNVMKKPELMTLKNASESIEELVNKTPEELCLRWLNFHIMNAKNGEFYEMIKSFINENRNEQSSEEGNVKDLHKVYKKCYYTSSDSVDTFVEKAMNSDYWKLPEKCGNFVSDMMNSRFLLLLFSQIIPSVVKSEGLLNIWFMSDNYQRAKKVVEITERIGCNKFLSVDSIVKGDHRLNFLFCQTMMNKFTGIDTKLIDIDDLETRLGNYENNILLIKDNLEAITFEMAEKEQARKYKEIEDVKMYRTIEKKTQEYENIIEDLKSSHAAFSRRVNEYVEDTLNVTLPRDIYDSNESLWATIMKLLSEIKVLKSERNTALVQLASQKELNQEKEEKIKELERIVRMQKDIKSEDKFSFFRFCGC